MIPSQYRDGWRLIAVDSAWSLSSARSDTGRADRNGRWVFYRDRYPIVAYALTW